MKEYTKPPPLTEDEVNQCTADLKQFYREAFKEIKADPMGLTEPFEFEKMYTNLSMINKDKHKPNKEPLKYSDLLAMKVDGGFAETIAG